MAGQQTSKIALKRGLTAGAPLALIAAVVTTLYDSGHLAGVVQCPEFLVGLAGFFIAGRLAARHTGRTATGAVAGLVASLLFAVVLLGANVIMASVNPTAFATAFGYHDMTSSALLTAALVQSLGGLVLWALFGAGLGALGGLLGRKSAIAATATVGD